LHTADFVTEVSVFTHLWYDHFFQWEISRTNRKIVCGSLFFSGATAQYRPWQSQLNFAPPSVLS